MRLTNFVKTGIKLFFSYPVAVIAQIISVSGMLMGIALMTGWHGVEQMIIWGAIGAISDNHPEYAGAFVFVVAIINFLGYFLAEHRLIFPGTALLFGFWIFVAALYVLAGVIPAALFYAASQVVILAYCYIYTTLKPQRYSPFRVLQAVWRSGRMDP